VRLLVPAQDTEFRQLEVQRELRVIFILVYQTTAAQIHICFTNFSRDGWHPSSLEFI